MRIDEKKLEDALKHEYIRGYLAAVEDMGRDVEKAKIKLEAEVVAQEFQEWCNTQKSCKDCPCNKYSDEVECVEAYTRAIREGRENETS